MSFVLPSGNKHEAVSASPCHGTAGRGGAAPEGAVASANPAYPEALSPPDAKAGSPLACQYNYLQTLSGLKQYESW